MQASLRLVPAIVIFVLLPLTARAQEPAAYDTVAVALARRDAGDLTSAARLLRTYVAAHPGHAEGARLLGETLYWLKDPAGAREVFESAIARHPSSVDLRLTYGRMLIETGDHEHARHLLEPLLGSRDSDGRAEAQLGIAAYWAGDHSAARRFLSAALTADPDNAEARTALRDILLAAAPRIQVTAHALSDDQPLERTGVRLSAKVFATPLLGIAAHVEPTRLVLHGGGATTLTLAEGSVSGYAPALRTGIEVAGGIAARETRSDWTGRGVATLRAPRGVSLRGRVERAQYLNTVASVTTPVMMETVAGSLEWAHRGWLAEATASRDLFADDNGITTGYVWLLAPLVRATTAEIHVGYAFTAQGADESRYTMLSGEAPVPGIPPGTSGAYVPYYTPLDLRSHQLLASLVLRPGERVTLRGSAGYGRAQENAESVVRRPAGPFQPPTYSVERVPRTFSPWNTRVSIDARLNTLLVLTASAESMRTAFYQATTLRAGLTQTIGTPSLRRLDRR